MVTVITFLLIIDVSLAVCALIVLNYVKRMPPLPPGPKRYPLVGNVLDMPTEREWLTFAKWGDTWGMPCFLASWPNLDGTG